MRRSTLVKLVAVFSVLGLFACTTCCVCSGSAGVLDGLVDGFVEDPGSTPSTGEEDLSGGPARTGGLTLGEAEELLVQAVGPEGGTLTVAAPDDPADGLTIEVPSGAYPEGTVFQVRSRPIQSHVFGPDFNPASPLIEIEAGAELAEGAVIVSVPAQIAPEDFGMAFAYEEKDGALEGLTFLDSDAEGVRFASRYLSRDFVVSTVARERLQGDIQTGFEHGVDDWQFRNYGSVLAPRGHCAGQSLTALYYFVEELGPPLYGQYDNYDHPFPPDTPGLQWDDEQAYRLASAAQTSIDFFSASRWFWRLFKDEHGDPGVYNAFAYSMLLTGAPQYVGLQRQVGTGHAMIVYGKRGNSLLISDPSYPYGTGGGESERTIDFDPASQAFKPYVSGPNARNLDEAYDEITYFGYKDAVDWQALGELWEELEAGTVGGDLFPSYRLMVREGESDVEEELWNNHEAASRDIVVRVEAEFSPYLWVYDTDGRKMAESSKPIPITLQPGDNYLGFEIDSLGDGGDPLWVGFEWVRITFDETEERDEEGGADGPAVSGEMVYEGTWSDSYGDSGEVVFTVQPGGSVSLRYKKIVEGSNRTYPWQHVNGSHQNGTFELPFNEYLTVTGTFDEESVSGRGANEYGSWEFSGVRVD